MRKRIETAIILYAIIMHGAFAHEFDVSDYDATVNVSAGSKLNVRSGPGTSHAIIGARYKGDKVRVTHHDGAWRRIAWSAGQIAYVHGNYLNPKKPCRDTLTPTENQNIPQETTGRYVLRKAPSDGCIISQPSAGTDVWVKASQGNWRYIIISSSGQRGWIHKNGLRNRPLIPEIPIPVPQPSGPCDDRPDVTAWFESELVKQALTVNRSVRTEPYLDVAWLNFYFIVKTNGTADLKQKQQLADWRDCGVYFYGRLVSIDVPGNVLFGLLGHTAFEDRNDMNDIDLEDFLLAGAGAAQAVSDGRLGKARAFEMLVLGVKIDRIILKRFDPPCDQSAIQVGLDAANARGSLRDLVRRAQLPDENFICPIS